MMPPNPSLSLSLGCLYPIYEEASAVVDNTPLHPSGTAPQSPSSQAVENTGRSCRWDSSLSVREHSRSCLGPAKRHVNRSKDDADIDSSYTSRARLLPSFSFPPVNRSSKRVSTPFDCFSSCVDRRSISPPRKPRRASEHAGINEA